MTDPSLIRHLETLCYGRYSFADIKRLDWFQEFRAMMPYPQVSLLEQELPERFVVPSGTSIRIDYSRTENNDVRPILAVRIQELFGLGATPRIARGRVPLLLHLLAPNGRPAQVTDDLESFWTNTYAQVRKELKGRYPKHYWPDNPWTAQPTSRAKPRR